MKLVSTALAIMLVGFMPLAAKADSICHTPASSFNAALAVELGVCDASGNLMVKTSAASPGGGTANPGYTRIQDGTTTTLLAVGGYGAFDGQNGTLNSIPVGSFNLGYNGTTFDRLRTTQAFSTNTSTGVLAAGPVLAGTTGNYVGAIADATAAVNVTTATTTQVVAGTAGQNIYLFYAACQTAGTNASATCLWEAGTGATCGTGTLLLFGTAAQPLGTAAGAWTTAYAGNTLAAAPGSVVPAASPYVIPASDNLCVVTTGTTVNAYAYAETARH